MSGEATSKLDTVIYIVGTKRTLQLQESQVRRIIYTLVTLFLILAAVIGGQYWFFQQEQVRLDELYQRESLKNRKLQALLLEQRSESRESALALTEQEREESRQQAMLIEQQKRKLQEFRSVLEQREKVVQQLQVEKRSSQLQIDSLQQRLNESKQTLSVAQAERKQLEEQLTVLNQSQSKAIAAAKKEEEEANTAAATTVSVERLQMKFDGKTLAVNFRLSNTTNEQQAGRVGVTLSQPGKEETPVVYGSFRTIPFRIRRFRMISQNLRVKSADSIVRIVAWNAERSLVMDQTYPLPGN
ncbi:MAG: hypothetical protein VX420_07310 [SAR324 cluster bacterium]|nr:hypothetical protein [SAR324 cluster bacterium]